MPGICYASRSAEVCQESIKTWQRVVPVVGGCPASELRQHLSELVPTDVGDHINIHVNVITNDAVKRIWLHQLFKFLIWYQENVLTHPKLLCLVRFVPRERFRWYKISVSYGVGVMPEQFNHFDRVAPGVRTRPLKCCAISGLSSDSWRWRRGGSAH